MKGVKAAMFDSEILPNKEADVPEVMPHGDVKSAAEGKGIKNVSISLSSRSSLFRPAFVNVPLQTVAIALAQAQASSSVIQFSDSGDRSLLEITFVTSQTHSCPFLTSLTSRPVLVSHSIYHVLHVILEHNRFAFSSQLLVLSP